MTNLEWLKTLSAEELADWFYDEWLHHLQYRWSSSRGGLIIWLKDRKTESSVSEIPTSSKDEPQTDCNGCKFVGTYDTEFPCANCSRKTKDYYTKTEPQTDNGIGCSRCEGRFDCYDRDMPHAVHCNNYGKITDEPRTERSKQMREDTIKIKCETEGFDEALEQVDALVEAYDGFPPQVQIKNCHDCTIKIYPSQTKFIEVKDESQTERSSDD